MIGGNLSATFNALRVLYDPSLCLPHLVVPTFAHLPVPLRFPGQKSDIKAVILDKDNCFAENNALEVYGPYKDKFEALRQAYPGNRLLVVSNSSGTLDDKDGKEMYVKTSIDHRHKHLDQALQLSQGLSVPVLRHNVKKPGCIDEIIAHLRSCPDVDLQSPSEIAVVGDRLFTDVMMANMMGAWGVWIKDGVDVKYQSAFSGFERTLHGFLVKRGYQPPSPPL
ncbi:hypothetical protein H072_3560 [Dactylellina haptotyla CBS 200.50]|uniref:HAD-superfamily phosphatase n=1 Tax=Dactylellina haptotyla (strain CBS 200.50) TaxID=1284197 RepID=S8BSH5_DACHA|nr:hypothetical protein H072_3560 [Dactylellina haptotyla CBS 200.50]